ncbi:hypothetical protein F4808DRAFT_465400 [Astrocystis sublimbata]|nr:hypothetical protein F4808DRAFT_465400 [Astrocystis sublimbata]
MSTGPSPILGILKIKHTASCDFQLSGDLVCPVPTVSPTGPSHLVEPVEKFVAKVTKGMQKIGEQEPKRGSSSTSNIGVNLMELQQKARQDGTVTLEQYLNDVAKGTSDTAWLATMYARYMGYHRRCIDSSHLQSGDFYAERKVKDREKVCNVTARVVNKLYPHWGVSSSLVFNALRETRFKASFLESVGNTELDTVADLVIDSLLGTELNLTILADTPVINPTFFLAVFMCR